MDHLAILSKKRKLLNKIISREKKIESRWYVNKKAPFGKISCGDIIYFKESGDKVRIKAIAESILEFDNLTYEKVRDIIIKYGNKIGIDLGYTDEVKDKKLCMLIFLSNVEIIEPFEIDKKGYGLMNAWISVDDISQLKKIPIS